MPVYTMGFDPRGPGEQFSGTTRFHVLETFCPSTVPVLRARPIPAVPSVTPLPLRYTVGFYLDYPVRETVPSGRGLTERTGIERRC